MESTEPHAAKGDGSDTRWISWEPGIDTLVATVSLLALWGAFLLCTWLRRDGLLFAFFAVYAVTSIAAVLLPTLYVTIVRGEAPSHLGVTTRRCWMALTISGLLGAALFPGLRAELSRQPEARLVPQLLYNGLLFWEPFFVFGWLQLRFERAFGIVPAIIFTALAVMIYHVGSLPAQYLPSMILFGVFNCSVFRLTGNLLTIWPVYFAVASAIGTLQGNIIADGSWVAVMAIVLLIEIAGFAATVKGRCRQSNANVARP